MLHQIIILQMALWRVLDIYKRGAKLRGQAPAKTTHFNSDKKINSKPSGSGRSPLNRSANRPVKPQSAFFEFCSFLVSEFFRFVLFRAACFHVVLFFVSTHHKLVHFCHTDVLVLLFNRWYVINTISSVKTFLYSHVRKIFNCRKTCNSWQVLFS